jgi:hypothetical protein
MNKLTRTSQFKLKKVGLIAATTLMLIPAFLSIFAPSGSVVGKVQAHGTCHHHHHHHHNSYNEQVEREVPNNLSRAGGGDADDDVEEEYIIVRTKAKVHQSRSVDHPFTHDVCHLDDHHFLDGRNL